MNNLPEGFLENRLQELLADDDAADSLRNSNVQPVPPSNHPQQVSFDQPSAVRRPVNFDQPSAVRRPVNFDQPSAVRGANLPLPNGSDQPLLNHPTLANFDQPSGRRPASQAPNFSQPTRPPQRGAQAPGNLDQMRQPNNARTQFDQTSRTNAARRANFDSPSRVQQQHKAAAQRPPQQNAAMDWSSSLLNSISTYDEKTQPDTAELLQGALEALTDAVIITDCNGRLIWANRYASELLDMPATSLMGTPATAVFGKYAAAFVPAELLLLAPSGRLNDWQINLLLPSAVRRTMVFNFALTRRNGEQVVVAIGHEYREPAPAETVPDAPATRRSAPVPVPQPQGVERITVRLRNEAENPPFPKPSAPPPSPFELPQQENPESNFFTPSVINPEPGLSTSLQLNVVNVEGEAPKVTLVPSNARQNSATVSAPPAPAAGTLAVEQTPIDATPMTDFNEIIAQLQPTTDLSVMNAPTIIAEPIQPREAVISQAVPALPTPPALAPVAAEPQPAPPVEATPVQIAVATNLPPPTPAQPVAPPNPPIEAVQQAAPPPPVTQATPAPATNSAAPVPSPSIKSAEIAASQFWQFLEYAPEPMMVTDQRGRIVQLNCLAEGLFGYERAEMLGEKALALLAKQSRNTEQPRFPFGITDQSLNGVSEVVEVYGWHRDGAEFPLELTRRQTEDGHFVVLTLRPVTAPKPTTEELPEALPSVEAVPDTRTTAELPSPESELLPSNSLILSFNEHLRRHNRALGELSRSHTLDKKGLPAALAEITAVAAQALDTARVSIWLFNESRNVIVCQDLFEAVDERHSNGITLAAEQYPRYFAALTADRTISASDALNDERTIEFGQSYLVPNGITSKLDAPIRALGRQIGVVCHEHIGAARTWTPEDETFAASVADFVAMAFEAEQRKKAQASQARLAAVLTATPDCVSITDAHGRLSFLNDAGRKLVERVKTDRIDDLRISDLYTPEANARLEREILPAALYNGIWTGEMALRRANGEEMPVAQVTFIQQNERGEIDFIAHIHHDLTLQKKMEAERAAMLQHEQQLRRSAEEHIQHKDHFLSTVSHELRTPLTGIVGWVELLRSGTLDEDQTERALATIERDAQTQMKLVEDLLDASRVISDKLAIDSRSIELMNVVTTALDTVRPQIEEKSIRLNLSIQPWVGPFNGDESRMQQVVWNLLSNAVKFTPQGGLIEVALERDQTHAFITVRDSGIGIKPEFLPHLFERFRQQDGSTVRRHGGLGLGLAIAKHIVELHQGTITANSAGLNQGTEFIVTLPLVQPQPSVAVVKASRTDGKPQKPLKQRDPLLAGIKVLAVDDQPGARELFRTVLTQFSAEVQLASSAAEARQQLAAWQPHVIISDIGMPNEDGCEMMRAIRALPPEQGGHIQAIALTAYASEQDRLRALQSGFDLHLPKPTNPEELAHAVLHLVRPEQPAMLDVHHDASHDLPNDSEAPNPFESASIFGSNPALE